MLDSFAKFEGMLYGASPDRYRDHIAHAFRVWIIGHGILRDRECFGGLLFSDELIDGEKEKDPEVVPPEEITTDEWECMWALAALCHDLGYPLSHIDQINSLARDALRQMGLVHAGDLRFGFSQQMLPFHDTMIRLMASRPVEHKNVKEDKRFSTHLQNKYYLKFLKSFDTLKHGVVSAMLVSKSLVYFRSDGRPCCPGVDQSPHCRRWNAPHVSCAGSGEDPYREGVTVQRINEGYACSDIGRTRSSAAIATSLTSGSSSLRPLISAGTAGWPSSTRAFSRSSGN